MKNEKEILKDLKEISLKKFTAKGEKYLSLSVEGTVRVAQSWNVALREIEIAALRCGIIPERYQRNMGTLGFEGQIKLLSSVVSVIGLGGLGGLAAQLLARMGLGKLIIIDGDLFSDSNLNRQVFSSGANINESKASFTAKSLNLINGASEIIYYQNFAAEDNITEMLADSQVALDCLDNIEGRFILQDACADKGIYMVHGAVAGFMGQMAVISPGDNLLKAIYGDFHLLKNNQEDSTFNQSMTAEAEMGNPAATPAVVAAWQVSETVKILTASQNILRKELLFIDLLHNESSRIALN